MLLPGPGFQRLDRASLPWCTGDLTHALLVALSWSALLNHRRTGRSLYFPSGSKAAKILDGEADTD
jgi:hypothetical protein